MEKSSVNYEQDIHPLVQRMALLSLQGNIPLFIAVADQENSLHKTSLNAGRANHDQFMLFNLACQSTDIDSFLTQLITHAKANGHDSHILSAVGIPKRQPSHTEQEFKGNPLRPEQSDEEL